MCGIAGFVNFDGAPAEQSILRDMACAMAHRGPDGEGVHVSGPFGLAHRRLSIIDLETGAQPMPNEDASVWTVFNGEIYNFPELRDALKSKGHIFKTRSDTEVIVHLYEECGAEFPKRLNGMFAIAVMDLRRRSLLLARDRVGKKPLLYFQTPKCLAFASEFGALKRHPEMPKELDMQALWDYLSLQYIPAPRTAFKGVMKLPPANILEFNLDKGAATLSRYWRPDYARKSGASYADSKTALRWLVEDSIKRRMVSDVPLGVFLSGGLDSTIVAGTMCKISEAPVRMFTIGFDDPLYDERGASAGAVRHFASFAKAPPESEARVVEPKDFSAVERLVSHFGEPYSDASMLPTFLLSRHTRDFVTVALSGDGADELFGGYERYLAMKWLRFADCLPLSARRSMRKVASRLLPPKMEERSLSGRVHRILRAGSCEASARYMSIISRFGEAMKRDVCGPAFGSAALKDSGLFIQAALAGSSAKDPVERLMEADLGTYLPGDILPKVDIASMACSLEVRSPFLDYRIIELSASLPRRFKQCGATRKRILADAFHDVIPPGLSRSPKRGFGVPLAKWFRSDWLPILKERLLEGRAVKDGLLRSEALSSMIDGHSKGAADHSYALFSLLVLELFMEGR